VTPVLGTSLLAGHHGYFPVSYPQATSSLARGR
jgi:hypothetical protein